MKLRLLTVTLLVIPTLALAQTSDFDPSLFGSSLSISLSPQYPRPGQTVRLALQGVGVDIQNSAVVWREGTTVLAQGIGADSITVQAGELGSERLIEADVAADGGVRAAQAIVAPTQLDLLVGSDSYTPPFHRGRALPSAGTNLLVQASAHFVRTDYSVMPDSQITYTWKKNGQVLGSLSGRGRSSAVIPMQHLFVSDVIEVEAASSDATRSGGATIVVPSASPVLNLYQDHPLYGVLYNQALRISSNIAESEMTFAAVPFFARAATPDDPALSYAWRVNGLPVTPSATSPSTITINADNSTGEALIELGVTHAFNFYMSAEGRWNALFTAGAAARGQFGPAQ